MFFLDVAVIASYAPLLSVHMTRSLGFSPGEVAAVYAAGPIAGMLSPLLVGALADRVLAAERALLFLNLLRTCALLFAAQATSFHGFLCALALVALCTAPGGVLTSSMAFHHMGDSRRLGEARVWGAVSWILAVWGVSAYLSRFEASAQFSHTGAAFALAAALSASMALYASTLPHTPPPGAGAKVFAAAEAIGLLKRRNLAALVAGALLVAVVMQFNFILQGLFYTDVRTGLGLSPAVAAQASTVAQLLELVLFPTLGWLTIRFGLKPILLVGFCAWPIRFGAYALGQPSELVISAQILHGLSVVLASTATQIAIDRMAPRDLRASAQALLATFGIGLGSLLGQFGAGAALGMLALPGGGYRWPEIFGIPLAISIAALLLIAFFYREEVTPART
jgi:MFS family permease